MYHYNYRTTYYVIDNELYVPFVLFSILYYSRGYTLFSITGLYNFRYGKFNNYNTISGSLTVR